MPNKKNTDYQGCAFVKLEIENWDKILKMVDPNDVYEPTKKEYGLETNPHVTLLYGIKNDIQSDIVKKLLLEVNLPYTIDEVDGKISMFEPADYDVIKIGLKSANLSIYNERLKELPFKNDYANEYNPHLTIAYLKKGTGKKYVGKEIELGLIKATSVRYSNDH